MEYEKHLEWRLTAPPAAAAEALRAALDRLGMQPAVDGELVTATSPRSFLRNRWAAAIEIALSPLGTGSAAACTVRMSGDRHFTILEEIAAEAGPELFADRGAERLGTPKERAPVERLLRASEHVQAAGAGRRGGRSLAVVLTDARLFLAGRTEVVDEFPLGELTALRADGPRLTVEAGGGTHELEDLGPGEAQALAAGFAALRPATAPEPPSDDPIAMLERLAALRDRGVIAPADFEAKKAELLRRI